MQGLVRARPRLALVLDLTAFPDARTTLRGKAAHPGRLTIGANNLKLIDASDLQRARTVRARLRSDARRHGYDADALAAALTVQVLIDEKYRAALRSYAELRHDVDENVLTYVGTVSGLKSLISDAYVAEAADAFVLKPLRWSPTVSLIANEVAPGLSADGQAHQPLAATAQAAHCRDGSPRHLPNSASRPASIALLTFDTMTADERHPVTA